MEVLYNGITCIYLLSRRGDCVDFLVDSPLHTDMILLKLSKSEDSMIRANCSRALKNMTSDSSEALEIGAVASLIAMSLEVRISISYIK